jgi:hypothetical protein
MGKEGLHFIACIECKKPLWGVEIGEKYGSRWAAKKKPLPGVAPYEEYWHNDSKTAKRTDCPFCGMDYFHVCPLEQADDIEPILVPKFRIIDPAGQLL